MKINELRKIMGLSEKKFNDLVKKGVFPDNKTTDFDPVLYAEKYIRYLKKREQTLCIAKEADILEIYNKVRNAFNKLPDKLCFFDCSKLEQMEYDVKALKEQTLKEIDSYKSLK